jgi:flavin-dependent dehydrogenase
VLVLEREKFPRFHIGESLLPFANDIWKELGVFEQLDARFNHKPGAFFLHEESGASFTYYFDTAIRDGRPYAYQVKRADFDKMLLDKAQELGAEVREEHSVDNIKVDDDGVTVFATSADGAKHELRSRFFVDATGRDALLCNRHRLKVQDGLITTNVAVHCMYTGVDRTGPLDEGNIIVGLFNGGWYWMIPFNDGDVSVGMVFEKHFTMVNRGASPGEMMCQAMAATPHLVARMKHAKPLLPVGSQANWSYRASKFWAGPRTAMVGDAAAFVDPLFSTGVLLAANGAKFCAEAVHDALAANDFSEGRFQAYQDKCTAGMDIFKTLVHEFYAQNLRKVLIVSARNPTVCSVITSMLAGDVYVPSMWHSLVRQGFSDFPETNGVPGARSSRDLADKAAALRKERQAARAQGTPPSLDSRPAQ